MADLDALSREIAATSGKWMVPGVRCVDPVTGAAWRLSPIGWSEEIGDVAQWHERQATYRRNGMRPVPTLEGPDLTDAVTVNSLLGAGSVWQSLICNEFTARIADAATFSPDRTEAICRAWIAAHKEKP